ncbi:hypothetical protein PTSG_01264 [Salpingoeca rosetta]|uniref:Ubiquitin-related modifier 1 homolog n=1 Tax=Salpingoeca rosetta (strain ATCC 50818 / BSB-021) TaxID=946362 RepID=F2TZU6_SALR5|nr:uncharacterized protein PTSG_01264 [Salpingoeca rosetta]EGD80674.1 hypothetical protein PTSG_01264 [Salpingoeca rosetta]|eukprot:XP_004997235.1 hypothetical protein PTSG_01264 [Salpingoeca rosetta]
MKVSLEFSGGAELLVDGQKNHDVTLPDKEDGSKWTVKDLLAWIKDNLIDERPELFVQGDTVRPGILVLINGTDWELMDGPEYELCEGDAFVFISTLHGG